MNTRICKICLEEKSLDLFFRDKIKLEGRRYTCKSCDSKKLRVPTYKAPEGLSKCGKCKQEISLDNFYKSNSSKNKLGIINTCKNCCKERYNVYFQKNRDEINKREAIKRTIPEYKEKKKSINKNWWKNNPDKSRAYVRKRQANKINATPKWANLKYVELFYKIAIEEQERIEEPCHVDHIVPLDSKLVCGLHNEFNLQVVTATYNSKKGNRFWPDMPNNLLEVLKFYGLK